MKKLILSMLTLLTFAISTQTTKAMTFAEGLNDSKPMALLIYANWADGAADTIGKFKSQQAQYEDRYNFILLDIASEDTKEFNKNIIFTRICRMYFFTKITVKYQDTYRKTV